MKAPGTREFAVWKLWLPMAMMIPDSISAKKDPALENAGHLV